MADMAALRRNVAAMANELVKISGLEDPDHPTVQWQGLATFIYGMVFAVGQTERLSPPEVQALVIGFLRDAFGYSPEESAEYSSYFIKISMNKEKYPSDNAMIHRGIDGHRQWQQGDMEGLRANIGGIIKAIDDKYGRKTGRQG